MSRYTPGEWTKHTGDGCGFDIDAGFDTKQWSIVGRVSANTLGWREVSEEEAEANANLFAAAPALLAACEEIVRRLDERDHSELEIVADTVVRAAIAKAKGETP